VTEGRLRCRFWKSLATRGSAASGATLLSRTRRWRSAGRRRPAPARGVDSAGRRPPRAATVNHVRYCAVQPPETRVGARAGSAWREPLIPQPARFTTRSLDVDGLTTHATAAQQLGQPLAELGLGGRSDADVGLWGRLIIATLVLDKPIVLRGRVLEHPEGIAGRADSRLRFALPA
jgi:hypothetical protein